MGEIKKIKSLTFPGDENIYVLAPDAENIEGLTFDADSIYFQNDLITSFEIGNFSLTNGVAVIPAAGKTLSEVWNSIYVKEINTSLQNTKPSCSMSVNNNNNHSINYYLVGETSKDYEIKLGLNKGAYDYGYGYITSKDETDPPSGTPAVTRVTTDGTGVVPISDSPYTLTYNGSSVNPTATNGNVFSCKGVMMDEASAQLQCSGIVEYENAGNPVSNLGKIYPEQAYANGRTAANEKDLARWYCPIYQGFTYEGNTGVGAVIADHANITADQLKTKLSAPASGSTSTSAVITGETAYSKTKLTKAVASKAWRQYYLAYPESYNFDMSAAKDGNNIDCTIHRAENVTLTFNGVNVVYAVYYINNEAPYETKTISWTLN